MLKDGLLSPYNASMESIHTYFTEHPDKLQLYLNRNKRYTFFRIQKGEVVGSLGVPLTPERSIATDKQIFPSGGLSYIVTTVPVVNSSGKADKAIPWSRFVLNQDEGGAIRGPHRVDIFWGAGDQARKVASHLNHPGKLYYLILKDATERENSR
jgi:membrane-bound lytic murein transglycosylase A